MDQLKVKRKELRRRWTNVRTKLKAELDKDPMDLDEVSSWLKMGEDISDQVFPVNEQIIQLMIENNATEAVIMEESDACDDYNQKFLSIKSKAVKALDEKKSGDRSYASPHQSNASGFNGGNRSYNLPKMKLKEFNGEYKEWLGWWAQFKRIHDDPNIDISVKFHYLDMAIVKGTRARTVLDIYPKMDENYPKAVAALKHRFGRDKLQVEVYVRELIKLLINNVSQKEKMQIAKLYDMLESHLKVLESLGVTSEKNEAILFPLVESCLPVGVLRAWERSEASKLDGARLVPPKTDLDILMDFLRREVESEQRISLAMEAFGTKEDKTESRNKDKFAGRMKKSEEGRPATAAGLVNEVDNQSCVFCSGSHTSENCGKAREMTLSYKKDKLRKAGRCFICIKKGCWAKKCNSSVNCYVCGKKHHTFVCPGADASDRKGGFQKPKEENEEKVGEGVTETTSTANIAASSEVYLQTAMVEIVNGSNKKIVRALFDTGSQRTHILSSTARELGLEVKGTEPLTHVLFGGIRKQIKHNRFQVAVRTKDASYQINMNVLDQDVICNKLPSVPKGAWMSQLREDGIWLDDMDKGNEEIQMLIGGDIYGSLLTGRIKKLSCGLTAVETKLGWTVMGTFKDSKAAPRTNHSMVVTSLAVSQLSVPDLWRLETIGIQDPIELKTQEEEEAEVMHRFRETVKRRPDGRYIVKLPWRCDVPDLPNNRRVAEIRLQSATKKLKSSVISDRATSILGTVPESASLQTQGADWSRADQKQGFTAYDKVFREWLDEGIIEEISDDNSEKCHYLPHRAVIKEESTTTKIRPVFDASCKSGRAPSLNDCLEKGPNLVDLIPSVMLRFRLGWIGVISDIRKAFLMIEVDEEDQDYLRFLWWEEENCERMKVFRHKRVVFGVNSSPFLLGAVIQYHLAQYTGDWMDVAEKIVRSLYVDNCVASVNTEMELVRFRETSISIMAEAGMDLRLWQDSLNVTENMDERVVPVLGMKWDRFTDELFCDASCTELKPEEVTKRQILSVTQQIFDPMGIICPVTVQPKVLLQGAWAQKKGWDELVDKEASKIFIKWNKELPQLSQIRIPRCFRGCNEDVKNWSLHCFTDASSYAYGAVVFLRCEAEDVSVQLLQAKARVAPLKKAKKNLSIPRLELVGCLIGARLMAAVINALDLKNVSCTFWSDSSTALSWIQRNDDWGTFVGNRVRDILKLSQANQWNHVPGKMNPADLPSRGCNAAELLASRWWEGPEWLKGDPADWPQEERRVNEEEVIAERKKLVISTVAVTVKDQWYRKGYSGYSRMIRRATYVFRFVDIVAKRIRFQGEVTQEELEATEKRLVLAVQAEVFREVKTPRSLKVFMDNEGILRVKTKLLLRQDQLDFRTPMLLPTSHPFVTELIREMHLKNSHAGAQALISILREKFWIFHTRTAVNEVIGKCQRCRRHKAKNVEVESAPLPEDRVRDTSPFEISGVDLAGPLFLRNKKKAWIVLFTCAVYRGVHLELVTSLDTDHFIQALRRFIARRGRPSVMYSDNGTNFRGAANLLSGLDWEKIERNFAVSSIQWKFSPPSAPWWGGFWERMVREVKGLLVRVLGRACVYYEELMTILCDVESVVNQRPLTVMTEDNSDFVALTPAMFLQGVRESGVPDMDALDRKALNRRFQYRQDLVDQLRSRFRTEYLANLLDRVKTKPNYELRKGDLVIISEDKKKRLLWQLGKVEGFIGKRIAKVKTPGGICTRPVRRLYPMELNPADEDHQPEVEVFTRRGRLIKKPIRFQ